MIKFNSKDEPVEFKTKNGITYACHSVTNTWLRLGHYQGFTTEHAIEFVNELLQEKE